MKQANIDTLERFIHHWHSLKFAGSVNMRQFEKEAILSVYKDELQPKFGINLWCGNCLAEMVRTIYLHYERTAASPIMDCVLKQTTTYPNGTATSQQAQAKPRKPKSDKRRQFLQAGEQPAPVPEVPEPSSDSTPG